MRTYKTEVAAFGRVHILARDYGIWPGIRKVDDHWELLYDPDPSELQHLDD